MMRIIVFLATVLGMVQCYRFGSKPLTLKPLKLSESRLQATSKQIANGLAILLSSTMFVSSVITPVQAANYGGFGSTYSAVLDPKTAVLNEEVTKSEEFKSGLKGLGELKTAVSDLQSALSKDTQLDVGSKFKTSLNVGTIRDTLNKYNSVFAEDTQKGTDRLIRGIIQDVTELERESAVKPGKARSDVKVQALQKRLAATLAALNDLSAFYSK